MTAYALPYGVVFVMLSGSVGYAYTFVWLGGRGSRPTHCIIQAIGPLVYKLSRHMIHNALLVERFIHLLDRSSKERQRNKEVLKTFFQERLFSRPSDITVHDIGKVAHQTHICPEEWFRVIIKYLTYPSVELEGDYRTTPLINSVRRLLGRYPEPKEVEYLELFLCEQLFVDPGKINVNDIYIIARHTQTSPEEWFSVALYASEVCAEAEGDIDIDPDDAHDFDGNY